MRAPLPLLPLAALVAVVSTACSSGFGDGTNTDPTDDGGSTDHSGDGGMEIADDLPAVDQGLDTDSCEGVYEDPVPGASVYFIGTFERISGDEWTGSEEYRLYANQAARDAGGQDCSVFWNVEAVEADPGDCATCDLGLALSAELDGSRTTCGKAIYEKEEDFSVEYGIKLSEGDSVTEWFFAATGNELGRGYAIGSPAGSGEAAMNYITDLTCEWFVPVLP